LPLENNVDRQIADESAKLTRELFQPNFRSARAVLGIAGEEYVYGHAGREPAGDTALRQMPRDPFRQTFRHREAVRV
jgi:hypothetical protein